MPSMPADRKLEELIARARKVRVSAARREVQRRSFAYGNLAIEDATVSKSLIDRIADELKPSR
jgi:hypothetical protein